MKNRWPQVAATAIEPAMAELLAIATGAIRSKPAATNQELLGVLSSGSCVSRDAAPVRLRTRSPACGATSRRACRHIRVQEHDAKFWRRNTIVICGRK